MFLRGLELRNIRSIKYLELSIERGGVPRRWTLLLGENGTGKSTVLRAAALLLAGSDALVELLREPDAWIRQGETEALIAGVVQTAEGEQRSLRLTLRRGQGVSEMLLSNREGLEPLDRALKHAQRSYLTVGYGASRRSNLDARSFKARSAPPRAQSVATLFAGDAALVPVQSWAMEADYRTDGAARGSIFEAFEKLLPGMRVRGIDKARGQLLFDTPDGVIALEHLSDGYQNMAAWCGDLLYRITEVFGDYREPLKARGLLLLDEIDLHLHPVWQRRLRSFLDDTLPNLQILATTHSPLTTQQCDEGELFALQRDERGDVQLRAFGGTPRDLLTHQLLLDPIFGLGTVDSRRNELVRGAYETLKRGDEGTREGREALEAARAEIPEVKAWTLATARSLLEDAPAWHAPAATEQTALLARVEDLLKAHGAAREAGPAKPAPRRRPRKGATRGTKK